jgi:N-acetylglucosaminyldiphosphoundecaprenol N-acetyl-beta-D-mannosaminyltransferase
LLGSPLDIVDMDEAVARCEAAITTREYLQHMSINAAKLVSMREDVELREGVEAAGLVTADGQSVVWAARLFDIDLPERVAGIDLMERMLAAAAERGHRVYFLGAEEEVLRTAIAKLRDRHPNLIVAGSQHGYFSDEETDEVAAAIRASNPDILFVAMSSPRKEHFLGRLGPSLGAPFAMGVGGSVDVIAGLTKRAPVVLQRAGLEWAYRMAQEPRRLGKRYLAKNLSFIWMVLRERLTTRRPSRARAPRPPSADPGAIERRAIKAKRGFWSLVGGSIDFRPQPLGLHIDPDGLAGYYSDLRGKTGFSYADMVGNEYEWVIPMAQAALGNWELRLEGGDTSDEFLRFADWLLSNGVEGAGGIVWRTDMAVPKYGLEPGWISAMGQGQAISVLLRAHALTGQDAYVDTARAALEPLLTPVADGGVLSSLDGVPVLEEYPTEGTSAVLNGWIFALWGVHELATVTGEERARTLFRDSAEGLTRLLPRYDTGWWSLYSLYEHGGARDLAKPFYQRLHPVMLEGLALITGAPELRHYAERWRRQDTRSATIRAAADKVLFRARRELFPTRR